VTRGAALTRAWYAPRIAPLLQLLRPLAWLFGAVVAIRRHLYRRGILRTVRVAVPVVIVGNISVGGTGKTPLVVALVSALQKRGRRPGIVSRGYGRATHDVRGVLSSDDPLLTGDEPLLLAQTGAPTWVGADRVEAAQAMLRAHADIDSIVADDGLQHYALARDVEIAVVDGARGLGNGLLLPAGPLREPPSRLRSVDAVVTLVADEPPTPRAIASATGTATRAPRTFTMVQEPQAFENLVDVERELEPAMLRDVKTVAIAGIANPDRFFDMLRRLGFSGRTVAFPDHHRYTREDVAFPGTPAVLMTAKDAVKCRAFADARMWTMPIRARIDDALVDLVLEKIDGSEVARNARLPRDQGAADLRPRA
jgi:tetraacyldisaccharide 4'-kinase